MIGRALSYIVAAILVALLTVFWLVPAKVREIWRRKVA